MLNVEYGSFEGHKTIMLGNGKCKPLTFGLGKAEMILEAIPQIQTFVKDERVRIQNTPVSSGKVTDTEKIIEKIVEDKISRMLRGE